MTAPEPGASILETKLEAGGKGAHRSSTRTNRMVRKSTGKPPLTAETSIRERVALLAYSYWETRGGQGGSPEEDWFRAERELLENLEFRSSGS